MAETHYDFPLLAFAELQLQNEVAAALPAVLGVCGAPGLATVVFPSPLSAADQSTLSAVVAAHTPAALTPAQKLAGLHLPGQVAAAVVLRLSSGFLTLPLNQQTQAQAIIDAAANAVAAKLSS